MSKSYLHYFRKIYFPVQVLLILIWLYLHLYVKNIPLWIEFIPLIAFTLLDLLRLIDKRLK